MSSNKLSAVNLKKLGTSSRKLGEGQDDESSQTGSKATTTKVDEKKSRWFGFGVSIEEEEEEEDDLSTLPDVGTCQTIEEKFRAVEVARLRTLKRRGQMSQFWEERARKFEQLPLPAKAVQSQVVLDRIAMAKERERKLLDETPIDPYAREVSQAPVHGSNTTAEKKRIEFDPSTELGRRLNQFRLAGHSDKETRDLLLVLTVQEDVRKRDAANFSVQTVSGIKKRPIGAPKFSPTASL